ncbi:diguanylate cyclase [Halobacillus yeomjeoni]|uniref:Diguanylate cyclase n=1 Tax=Halobacillus yeomjeoni TaxID=311194 RepID=A0A931HVS8_9BACI|nr:diguanylate cyclase [Halobacillus yeomjeoni]MBH0230036.1 diguanylate cyclase [Halobacillus yeomjeoni]
MTKSKQVVVWSAWALLWPASLIFLFDTFGSSLEGNVLGVTAFIILAAIVALFPLQIGDNPVFFTHGIALAAFLYFGLLAEILVSQAALIMLMFKLRVDKSSLYRIPINFLMFLFLSITSAMIYYALGGTHGRSVLSSGASALPIIAYALSQILLNQFTIKGIAKWLYGKTIKWVDRGFIWDLLTGCLVLPIGLVLYIVYSIVGVSAIFFVGIPFIFISGMLMLYHNSNQMNTYLKKTSNIGHELTGKLGVREVLDLFVERISELLPLDYVYIYDVVSEDRLKLIRFFDKSKKLAFPHVQLMKGECMSGHTWWEGKSFHFHNRKQWEHLRGIYTPADAESVLSIPIERNNEIVGIISIYSKKKRAFMQFQFIILNILSSYLGVAIDNARHYELKKSESERCPLTNLYNYRFLEGYMHKLFSKWTTQNAPISLILLDIDHFKQVNDTYGHESGNEILCQFAERIQKFVGNEGIAARYGGEEFAVLLPDKNSEEAVRFAEKLREEIEGEPFHTYEHILSSKLPQKIDLTASIGVATFPDDCDAPMELIRSADRAMYVGAKRRGRNRVASYNNLKKFVQ